MLISTVLGSFLSKKLISVKKLIGSHCHRSYNTVVVWRFTRWQSRGSIHCIMYLSNWTRQYCTPGNEATCEISHHQLRADKGFQTLPGLRTGLEGWLAAYQPFFLAGNWIFKLNALRLALFLYKTKQYHAQGIRVLDLKSQQWLD